jgi:hypothetical protein
VSGVADLVCTRYQSLAEDLLTAVRKTESSLKRLKRNRPGEAEGGAGVWGHGWHVCGAARGSGGVVWCGCLQQRWLVAWRAVHDHAVCTLLSASFYYFCSRFSDGAYRCVLIPCFVLIPYNCLSPC